MTKRTWNNSSGGNFNTATDWTPNGIPAAGDDASITASGTYTVSSTVSNTVASLETASGATLAVGNNTTFEVTSSISNAGAITINSAGSGTDLELGGNVSLSGGGHVVMTDNASNAIVGASAADSLTNVNNTISGSGQFDTLTLINDAAGVIDATGSANKLELNTSSDTVTNAGLIEDTGTAGLLIVGTAVNNAGGTIEANGANSVVDLESARINGGTLLSSGGGVFQTLDTGSILDGTVSAVADSANINILNNSGLTLRGTITNTGTISVNSSGNGTNLIVDGIATTLAGGGHVTLTDNAANLIEGTSGTAQLINVNNTISGAGQLGNGQMTLVNEAAGVINGSGVNNALIVDTGGADLINQGLMEGTGTGGLEINSTGVSNTGSIKAVGGRLYLLSSIIDNSPTTTISSTGVGAHIDMQSSTIIGGVLTLDANSALNTLDTNNTIDNVAVTNAGTVNIENNTGLTLGSTVTNTGSIALNSAGNGTNLIVDGNNATLTGGGHLTLTDNAANLIEGVTATDTLTNVNNTISGSGSLGNGQLTLINEAAGVIDATGSTNQLKLDTAGSTLANAGLIEDTGTAGLLIDSTTVNNAGGTIEANGANSVVDLESARINGGTLLSSGGGVFQTLDGASILDGTTGGVSDNANINILNNTALTLRGAITNTGTISLNSAGNNTDLIIDGANTTLSGGGSITMTNNSANVIAGNVRTDVLTNVNNTISGAGQIDALTLVNEAAGVIDGSGASAALAIDSAGAPVTNQGLMEGTSAGGLEFNATMVNNSSAIKAVDGRLYILSSTIDNSPTGTISSAGVGAHIDLQSAFINGGVLTLDANSTLNTLDTNNHIDNVAVTNAGVIDIANSTELTLGSTVTNTGSITLNSSGNGTALIIDSNNATLTGTGQVTLSDSASNVIEGAAASDVLDNVSNTISGAGALGNGQLTLINGTLGVIDASYSGASAHQLVLDTGHTAVQNSGKIESTGTAGLLIQSTTIDQGKTGFVETIGTGSLIDLASATIVGGTVSVAKGSVMQTLDNGSLIDASKLTNAGTITINNSTGLTLQGKLTNASTGVLALDSLGNGTDLYIAATGATLSGGKVTMTDFAQNTIIGLAPGALLTNDTTITGSGNIGDNSMALLNASGKTIDATGTNNQLILDLDSTVSTNQGTMEGTGSAGLEILNAGDLSNSGIIKAATGSNVYIDNSTIRGVAGATNAIVEAIGGSGAAQLELASTTLTGGKLITDSHGTIVTEDSGSIVDNVAVTNAGAINIANNTALTLGSTVTNTGSITLSSSGNGTDLFVDANNATLTGGGKVTLTDSTANVIEGLAVGDTLTNVNNTITGAGNLGNGQLTLINEAAGVINATYSGSSARQLVLNTGAAGSVTNTGLIEDTGTAGLLIQGTLVNNAGGTIEANGANTAVDLQSADISGGTLLSSGGGVFQTLDSGSILDGSASAVSNNARINLLNNTELTIRGAINNTGTISLNSVGNGTDLFIDGASTTLTGGGTISMTDNLANVIEGNASTNLLTNVNNAITGSGQLGAGRLTFVNDAAGVVDGTGANGILLDTSTSPMTNAGLMEGTSSGGLEISSTGVTNTGSIKAVSGRLYLLDSTIDNSATATISSAGAGALIEMQSGTISGGILTLDANSTLDTLDSGSRIDNAAMTNAGTINIENNTALTLGTTVTNSGTISLESAGNGTDLVIDNNNATLTGGGNLTLTNNGANVIVGASTLATLDNANNTISGAGQIGDGQMTLVNGGTIDGNVSNALVINTGRNVVTNTGTIESSGSGGVTVSSTVNNSGKLWADGDSLAITGAVTGGGTGEITGAATLELGAGSTSSAAVTFDAGSTGTLRLDSSQSFAGTIAGLSLTGANELDLSDISFITGTTKATFVENGSNTQGVLTVTDGTHTASLTLLGNYASSNFVVASDSHGGTFVHDPAAPAIASIGSNSAHA